MKNTEFISECQYESASFDILRNIDSSHVMSFLQKFVESYDESDC